MYGYIGHAPKNFSARRRRVYTYACTMLSFPRLRLGELSVILQKFKLSGIKFVHDNELSCTNFEYFGQTAQINNHFAAITNCYYSVVVSETADTTINFRNYSCCDKRFFFALEGILRRRYYAFYFIF